MAQLKEGSIIKKSTGDEIIATLNDIPEASSIPTKTSELENDSGFVTSSEIPTSLPASGGDADTVGGFTVGVNVPANAKFTDTVYTHPVNHPASIITQTSTARFVTDAEKSSWNGKADATIASASANGLMSSAMFTKLNGLHNMVYLTESAYTALGTKDPNTLYLRY